MKTICHRFIIVFLGTLIGTSQLFGQQLFDDTNKFRLAQSLERSGEYEKAAKLYEELLARDPLNFVLFDGLHRMYVQLKEYGKAIDLVQQRLKSHSYDIGLLGMLGEDHLKAGREKEAIEVWEQALTIDERNQNVYRVISTLMMQNRLFAKSVDVLLRGRRAVGNPNLFAQDLAYAYTLLGKYDEATREYLRALKENPGTINFIQTRIALFSGKPDGLQAAIAATQEELRKDRRNVTFHRLLAWLYLEGKQFENALSVYRMIEELNPSEGQELLSFANRTLKDKAYAITAKAYKEVINRYPNSPIVTVAKFGLARAIEELSDLHDTTGLGRKNPLREENEPPSEVNPTYGGAITYYQEIARDYPTSEFAVQALFRISLIKFERFFDIDGALRTIDEIERRFPDNRIMSTISLKAGEIFVARGNIAKATEYFRRTSETLAAGEDEKDRATFALAEIDYFEGRFDSAQVKLKRLVDNLSADIANDALLLQQFIDEHAATNSRGLQEYARAELLSRQRKFSEATAVFEGLVTSAASSLIVDEVLLKLGELQTRMRNPHRAISFYDKLIVEHPESILRDKAQFGIAEVYDFRLKDRQKAINAYQRLLETYPTSLFLEEARRRIRQLRGDNL